MNEKAKMKTTEDGKYDSSTCDLAQQRVVGIHQINLTLTTPLKTM